MLDIFNILKDKSDITRKTYISKLNIIKKKYFPQQDDFEFIKKPLEVIKNHACKSVVLCSDQYK